MTDGRPGDRNRREGDRRDVDPRDVDPRNEEVDELASVDDLASLDDIDDVDDEELMDRLRAAVERLDAMPESVAVAARASFAMASLDSDLASLTFDSWVDTPDELLLMRSAAAPTAIRQLTFRSSGITVELQESPTSPGTPSADARSLIGQLVPPAAGRVDIRHRDGTTTVEADGFGRFLADGIPGGPISLRCTVAGSPPTDTEWVVL